MSLLEKIFDFINHILEIIWNAIVNAISALIPTKIKERYFQFYNRVHSLFTQCKLYIKSINVRAIIQYFRNSSLKDYIEILKKIVEKLKEFIAWAKSFDLKKAGPIPLLIDTVLFNIWRFISYPFKKIHAYFSSLTPQIFILVTTFSIMAIGALGYGGYAGYKLFKKFYPDQMEKIELYEKPAYYQKEERQLTLLGVYVPVYIEGSASLKSLRFDITIETSNRYTRNFLDSKKYLLQDRINSGIEPVIPTFPLSMEGKIIIKNKIKREIDLLIDEVKIDGNVTDVYVDEVMAN